MAEDVLSLKDARRIALAAQGFALPRPGGPVGLSHVRSTIRRLGLLQIDYVNVLAPAHYQVLFSRLGPYEQSLLDDLVYKRREFTEQWAREASIVPMEIWPLFRHRRETHRVRPYGFESFLERNPPYVKRVVREIRTRGPLAAGDLPEPDGIARRIPGAWHTVPRAVLEAHFGRGVLAVADRRPNFARVFDLAERIVPKEHRQRRIKREDAERELLRLAAQAHGIGTASDLADYYRMPVTEARPRLAELVKAGILRRTNVEGWREPAFMDCQAKLPRRLDASALLSPFDPVVWCRARALRLFEFDYRIEIFVPREKRRWGYYVLPFLLHDRLAARVDLRADRTERSLRVVAAYLERWANSGEVAEALATELKSMARWLDLESMTVELRGDFARALGAAVVDLRSW